MSFDAALYRLLHRGNPGDVDFYLEQCPPPCRVLELGCGDGRIAAPLAAAGCRVVGLELHPEMVRAAESRCQAEGLGDRLRIVTGDMADFRLGARFDRIIAPYTSLYCLSPAERRRCLVAARTHLAPGGRFIFDAYPGDLLFEQGPYADDAPEWIAEISHGDRRLDVLERDVHDAPAQRIDVSYIHEEAAERPRPAAQPDARRVTYTLTHHYLRTIDLHPTLGAAGLRPVAAWGDFDGRPLTPESDRMVVVAISTEPDDSAQEAS